MRARHKVGLRANPRPGVPAGWAERGACVGYPVEWWYPTVGDLQGGRSLQEARADAEVARRICVECCRVRNECLVYALHHREIGIWAGLDEEERQQMGRRIA